MYQLPLQIPLLGHTTFASFYPGDNQQLLTYLQELTTSAGEQFIYFWGASGTGRSHLLQACCQQATVLNQSCVYFPMEQIVALDPDLFVDLEMLDLVCIDDIQNIAGQKIWEESLFHLYNRIRETNTRLVISANAAPRDLALNLSDLKSRLAWGMTFQIHPLTDIDKLEALRLSAQQRGFILSDDVGQFLIKHCSRETKALFNILSELDAASLSAKHRLTIPFVKAVLKI